MPDKTALIVSMLALVAIGFMSGWICRESVFTKSRWYITFTSRHQLELAKRAIDEYNERVEQRDSSLPGNE